MQRIYRIKDLPSITGLCRSSIYEMMAEGDFPRPVKLSKRAVGWPQSDVDAWLQARIAERDAATAA